MLPVKKSENYPFALKQWRCFVLAFENNEVGPFMLSIGELD